MPIGGDWVIDYVNSRVYHNSGTTVYTVNALYSYIMDTMDELAQMGYTIPMSAQTPTNYTMINGWFIDDVSTTFLSGGAIATSGYAAGVIRMLTFVSAGYVNCIPTDVPLLATGAGGSTGTLLAYNNTTRKWWVRTTSGVFGVAEIVTLGGGGTGTGTTAGASATGEELYANVYTLGTIDSSPYPQVYIYQSGARIAEWSTLTNFDRGQIDVLIKVQEMGTLIDSANITVFARQYTDVYDNFAINLASGGRNAVPLATAKDLNNTTGEYYLFYDGAAANFATLNQIITGGTSGATAQLVAATVWTAPAGGNGRLTLCGIRGVFQDNEAITGSADGSGDVNGTLGDTYLAYDAQTGAFTVGQILTGTLSTAQRTIVADQDDGLTGKLCLAVGPAPTAVNYLPFTNNEAITDPITGAADANGASTTIVAGYSDVVIAFVNGTVTHGAIVGAFTNNEAVTYSGGGGGVFLLEAAGTMTLGNHTRTTSINGETITGVESGATTVTSANIVVGHTMNKTFPAGAAAPYDVIVDCKNRTLAQVYEYFKLVTRDANMTVMYTVVGGVISSVYGEEYTIAFTGYAPVKVAPFGSFAGGKLFGARGVWVEDMAAADAMNYQLIDSNGTTENPPTYAIIAVTSVVAGDRVTMFRTTAGTTINKAVYTSAAGNTAGDSDYVTNAPIQNDTPTSGVLRLVTVATSTEYRMRYDSWAVDTFTLPTAYAGNTTAAGAATVITDAGATFNVDDIEYGDIVRNTTTGGWAQVVSVDGPTQVTTTDLSTGIWGLGDGYEFNTLPVTFINATDKAYVPFIDEQATGVTCTVTVIYVSDRTVVVRVRKKGIIPFETTGTVISTGLSVGAIRTADTIVTP